MRAHEVPPPEFRGLLRPDARGALVPEAAWHWECDAGARRWSFHVRPDLYAPDTGARVTAHSFEERWRAVSLLPRAGGLPQGQCRSLDSWKLVVVLARPDGRLPHRLARSRLTLASRCLTDPLAALLATGPADGPAPG
ncbi:hypothetical protein [Streptomyces sp. NPDC002889]|uniref:hypothetical protein n=1 Tax=Streptomyces sp. NPDC002889 TaxID=3364669 RepID=UPI0036B1E542